jgi:AcrR family transcriptional regulator
MLHLCCIWSGGVSDTGGTRARLLEAAIAIIETEGESAVRVDRVVQSAGFTRPVLYRYFADRDALIVQAQAERYRRALAYGLGDLVGVAQSITTPEAFRSALRYQFSAFATAEGERRRTTRIEVLGSSISRPDLRQEILAANRANNAALAAFIADATERGLMSEVHEPDAVAIWIVGLLLTRTRRRAASA